MSTTVLGISAYYHDAAAALLRDGRIVAAAQEERFTRIKGDASFPHRAIAYCLREADMNLEAVDHIVFYESILEKFDRLMQSQLAVAPHGLPFFLRAMPKWLSRNLWLEREMCREMGVNRPIHYCEHHLSHAASAFFLTEPAGKN